MASPEARKILNPELLSKYRCVPKIGFGFKFGFEKGFRYKNLLLLLTFLLLFAGFQDFGVEFLVVIFVCSPVFLWNPTTSRLGKSFSVPKMASPEARQILIVFLRRQSQLSTTINANR